MLPTTMNEARKTDLRCGRLNRRAGPEGEAGLPPPGSGMDPLAEEILFGGAPAVPPKDTTQDNDEED